MVNHHFIHVLSDWYIVKSVKRPRLAIPVVQWNYPTRFRGSKTQCSTLMRTLLQERSMPVVRGRWRFSVSYDSEISADVLALAIIAAFDISSWLGLRQCFGTVLGNVVIYTIIYSVSAVVSCVANTVHPIVARWTNTADACRLAVCCQSSETTQLVTTQRTTERYKPSQCHNQIISCCTQRPATSLSSSLSYYFVVITECSHHDQMSRIVTSNSLLVMV